MFSGGLPAQTFEAVPQQVIVDQPAAIRAAGLQPNERVTIRSALVDGADVSWTAHADFVADGQGRIDTAKQAPVAGSYKEVSAMGLVWSMMPSSRDAGRYRPPKDLGVQTIAFHLLRGGSEIAAATLEQHPIAKGVARIPVHEGALRGLLCLPPGQTPHPGILVLGGSEGGMPTRRAAWLASHGYAALALAYFRFDDLPTELAGIPLEYFGRALNWMAHQSEIAADRIAVAGVSRGAELALQLASMFPRIKAVAAYSPANVRYPACCGFTVVPYAWSWNGNGLAFLPVRGGGALRPDLELRATIEVEHIEGPVLLISGDADRIWESSSMADAIVVRLKRHHFAYSVEHLDYPHAGHGAGRAEIVPAWMGRVRNPTSGRIRDAGGSLEGNAESSLDAAPKVLAFFAQSLSAH